MHRCGLYMHVCWEGLATISIVMYAVLKLVCYEIALRALSQRAHNCIRILYIAKNTVDRTLPCSADWHVEYPTPFHIFKQLSIGAWIRLMLTLTLKLTPSTLRHIYICRLAWYCTLARAHTGRIKTRCMYPPNHRIDTIHSPDVTCTLFTLNQLIKWSLWLTQVGGPNRYW